VLIAKLVELTLATHFRWSRPPIDVPLLVERRTREERTPAEIIFA
jgi:hypothetical protein